MITATATLEWVDTRYGQSCALDMGDGFTAALQIRPDEETRSSDFDNEPEDTEYYGVLATVSYRGVELGWDSLWACGVLPNSGTGQSYLDGIAHECAANALTMAKAKLVELKGNS